jgi:hypothetical protein
VDYEDTFSPVVKATVIHIVLSVVVLKGGICVNWMSRMPFYMVI